MKTAGCELNDSLKRITDAIENDRLIDSARLLKILKQADLKEDDFLPLSNFGHIRSESYGRTKIYQGSNYSVYIMSWSPGDFTAIHSHGLSEWGAVYFFGDINHRLYKVSGNCIDLAEKGIVPEGSIVLVNGNLVHAMGNLGEKPVMTLHIYGWNQPSGNANDNSMVYELEKDQIRTTDGSAFINIDDTSCKKTEKGIISGRETLVDYFEIIKPFYERNEIAHMVSYLQNILLTHELLKV